MKPPRITIDLEADSTAGSDLCLVTDHDGECHLADLRRWPVWKATRARLVALVHARHLPTMNPQEVHKAATSHLEATGILRRDGCAVLRFEGLQHPLLRA